MIDIVRNGLPIEEIRARLANGWMVVPGVKIAESTVLIPGMPPEEGGRADLWILPQLMVPQVAVAKLFLDAFREGLDEKTLDWLSTQAFKQTIAQLAAQLEPQPPVVAPEGEEAPEAPEVA